MERFTLHVPLQRNDGTDVTDTEFGAIESELLELSDGFTSIDGVGAWRSGLTTYREPVRMYMVDSSAPKYTAERLILLAEFVASALEQEAVYITRTELSTTLVAPNTPSAI